MSDKRNAPGEMAVSAKGATDGVYDSSLSQMFGQVCMQILHLNERKGAEGYGEYSLNVSDVVLAVDHVTEKGCRSVYHAFRSELESVGMLNALRCLSELLEGEE